MNFFTNFLFIVTMVAMFDGGFFLMDFFADFTTMFYL
jgi:hypothetical protein